jgi:sulfate adenylyltransferase large subunit
VKAGGLLPQSRRHTFIASLLRIPHIVAAINKMDLVDYSEDVFREVRSQFLDLARDLNLASVELIPVSALVGDNIVEPSTSMPWYEGPTLLEYLETVPLQTVDSISEPLRFPVQLVLRPDAVFRGFAGRVERGELRVGQMVRALPSGQTTRVSSIATYDGDLNSACTPESVTVTLEDEIDLSRGEMLVDAEMEAPVQSNAFSATLVWMSEQPLAVGQSYFLKHTTRVVRAKVRAIRHRMDVVTGEHHSSLGLQMNDIAEVEFETNLRLFFDRYEDSRPLGSFILIDPISNATAAAGMITAPVETNHGSGTSKARSAFVWLSGNRDLVEEVRQILLETHRTAIDVDDALIAESALAAVARALQLARVTALSSRNDLHPSTVNAIKRIVGDGWIEREDDLRRWLKDEQ